MGQKITLTETFTGTGLPILYDDAMMSAGSLVLNDVGHSLGAFSGIPINGGLIPNVAWKTANPLVSGAPGQSALSSTVLLSASLTNVSFPVVERTTKLGLHAIKSQANDTTPTNAFNINAAASILAYIIANPNNAYYMSVWDRVTRVATTLSTPFPGLFVMGFNNTNYVMAQGQGVFFPSSGKLIGSNASNGFGLSLGNRLTQIGVTGVTGVTTSFGAHLFGFGGSVGPFSGLHIGPSQIFYRVYFEDMTVSAAAGGYVGGAAITVANRFIELQNRDTALYNAAFAVGGKFYNDSFTNPNGTGGAP